MSGHRGADCRPQHQHAAKNAEVTAAAQAFVRSSNPDDQMFVVNFNEKVYLGLSAAIRFTDSPPNCETPSRPHRSGA